MESGEMKGKARHFFFFCVLMLCGVSVCVADELPDGKTVSEVRIDVQGEKKEGISSFSNVEKSLKTKEQLPFSNADFDEDLKLLLREFDDVDPKISVEGNRVRVLFLVKKQPVIHSITFQGNKAVTEDTLRKQLSISQGTLLNRAAFNEAVQKIRNYYLKKGYFEAHVQYDIVASTAGQVDIVLRIHEGKAGFVDELVFHNFTEKEEKEIENLLMTQPYVWWHSWLTDQGTFYQDVFRHDELTILTYLHNEGYLDAVLDTKVLPSTKKDRIVLDISVQKGEIYRLGTIGFSGNTLFTNDILLKRLNWKEGTVFSQEMVREKTRDLYLLYGGKGYIDASITPESFLREKEHVYDVRFSIEEKQQYRVGLVHISGNKVTDGSVILHECLLVPGDILNINLLSKTEERLKNTGYFKSVNVYALKATELTSSSTIPFRDIHIEVEEQPTTANFTAFVGYSTTESVSGGVGFSESNFKMKGLTNIFKDGYSAVRGGGESLNLNVTVGTKQLSETISWVKPYIFDTPWIFSVDLMNEKNSYSFEEYSIQSRSAVFTGRYPLNPFLKYDLYYRLRKAKNDLHHIKSDDHSGELRRESKIAGTISAIGTGLEYDSTNSPFNPTEGTRSRATVEYAGLFGDHHFSALRYWNTLYWKPFEKGVFTFRGNMDFIQTLFSTKPAHLPLDERLYLGGEMSIRGYRFNTVGPSFRDKNRTPRGGMSSLLLSGEYAYPLWKKLDGFVFFDAGNVYWKEWTLGTLRYSTGFGIKFYITERAPLTIGLGFPLNPASKRDVQRFFLSIGAAF